jgi:transposase
MHYETRCGSLIKVLWHDGQGMCLFAKRLERGRFIWPSQADRTIAVTPAQLGSTGVCRRTRGDRKRPADCDIVNHCAIEGSQEQRLVVPSPMMSATDSLPEDVETLKRLLLASNAELVQARAEASSAEA